MMMSSLNSMNSSRKLWVNQMKIFILWMKHLPKSQMDPTFNRTVSLWKTSMKQSNLEFTYKKIQIEKIKQNNFFLKVRILTKMILQISKNSVKWVNFLTTKWVFRNPLINSLSKKCLVPKPSLIKTVSMSRIFPQWQIKLIWLNNQMAFSLVDLIKF